MVGPDKDAGYSKLTAFFGEQDRAGGRPAADELLTRLEQASATSVLLRGVEGFGRHRRLHTERLEPLSMDLPMVVIAVASPRSIGQVLAGLTAELRAGLVTLEPARLLAGDLGHVQLTAAPNEATKLTVYCGQGGGPVPDHVAVVDLLHRCGVAGATVLPGVDGTVRGRRERARLFGRSRAPLLIAVAGAGEAIATALPGLGRLLHDPLVTLERVQVRGHDWRALPAAPRLAGASVAWPEPWRQLMVYTGQERGLHVALIGRLLAAGASGATCLRGLWGYHGRRPPHGTGHGACAGTFLWSRLSSTRRHEAVAGCGSRRRSPRATG